MVNEDWSARSGNITVKKMVFDQISKPLFVFNYDHTFEELILTRAELDDLFSLLTVLSEEGK